MSDDGRQPAASNTDALLRTVLEAWPDLVYVKDREGRFIVANTATARLMGAKAAEELIGKTDFEYYGRPVAEAFAKDERDVLTTGRGKTDIEEVAEGPQGERVWLSTTKIPFFDGDGAVCGLVGIGRDITDRKRAEEELRSHQSLLTGVLESSPMGVAITRPPEGRLVFANSRLLLAPELFTDGFRRGNRHRLVR